MLPLFVLLACGEKEVEDTSVQDPGQVTDTAAEDTGASSEGNEGSEGASGSAGPTQLWSADTLPLLTAMGGCGDYFLYVKNPEDTLTLHISGSGLALEAHQADTGVVEYTYTIDPTIDDIQPSIVAQQGEFLNEWSCNDAVINEPRVDLEHIAISGTVRATVTAEGEMTDWGETPANITIEITDVCFEALESFCIPSYSIEQYIGWMPG